MLPQALDDITPDMAITDVAEALRLPRHVDGHFETGKISGQRLVLLGAGDLFAWQRQTARPLGHGWRAPRWPSPCRRTGMTHKPFTWAVRKKIPLSTPLSGTHAKHWDIGLWSR